MHHMGEYNCISKCLDIVVLLVSFEAQVLHLHEFGCLCRAEIEAYGALDPGVRVVILKALCDIRVEVFVFLTFLVFPVNIEECSWFVFSD